MSISFFHESPRRRSLKTSFATLRTEKYKFSQSCKIISSRSPLALWHTL
jgi:hypothetical protein